MLLSSSLLSLTRSQLLHELFLTVLLALLLAYGLVGIRSGGLQLWRAALIARSDPIDAGAVYLADGEVELEGTVEPIETTTSRYTNTECVAYDYELKERERRTARGETVTSYETVESGAVRRPFYLRDETGAVAIDPDGAALSLDTETVSGGHRKRYESRLEPGETVHVYGQQRAAVEADDRIDGEETVVGDGDAVSQFTITDTTEFRTTLRYVLNGFGRLFLFTLLTVSTVGLVVVLVLSGTYGVVIWPVRSAVEALLDGLLPWLA